jgi:hypothetical protein
MAGCLTVALLLAIVAASLGADNESMYEETSVVVLKTRLGALRGHREVVDYGFSYVSFKGIRYGKAPVRERRFQVNGHFGASSPHLDLITALNRQMMRLINSSLVKSIRM